MIRSEGEKTTLRVPFGEVIAERTDFVGLSYFIWIKLDRCPTRKELVRLWRLRRRIPSEVSFFTNVDSRIDRNMRFAKFFGFREVRRTPQGIAVMVLER